MVSKEELFHLIEELPEERLDQARVLLERLRTTTEPRLFETVIERCLQQILPEELEDLPTDIGENLDHYVSGLSKS